MTPTNRAILISSLLAGTATAVGGYLIARARAEPRRLPIASPSNVIPILSPVI